MLKKKDLIFVAGHNGFVGKAICRRLKFHGFNNILTIDKKRLDLRDQKKVFFFLNKHRPKAIIIAAAKTGGIYLNSKFGSDILYDNLCMQNNLIEGATYFGMANGLLASSTIMLPWKNETFRDPIGGDIIRRTSFYSHILMKKIFNDETKMTSIEIKNNGSKNSNPAISFYSYFNATFNSNWIYFANKTGNEISLSEIIVDSKSKKNLTGQFYCLSGPSLYSSFGATKFEYEYKINEVCKWTEEKIAISNMKIPGYSTGCFEIKN